MIFLIRCASGAATSDEPVEVQRRSKIALAVQIITSLDVDIEAASAKVRAIQRRLVVNNALTICAASQRTVRREKCGHIRESAMV